MKKCMKQTIKGLIILSTVALFVNCATQRASTITGGNYDAAKDVTDYMCLFTSDDCVGKS